MAERKQIGIIYDYNEDWIGGTYYIQNLIAALGKMPNQTLSLVIFTELDKNYKELVDFTSYPFLEKGSFVIRLPFLKRITNRIVRFLTGNNLFNAKISSLELVFPAAYADRFPQNQQFLFWIPDFQEHYLPEYFSPQEIKQRKKKQLWIVNNGKNIVFSSIAAKTDFNKIYPENKLRQFVLPFAVTHPNINLDSDSLEKYGLQGEFFICSNQFWKHKDHFVILKALDLLKRQGKHLLIIFTGKEEDYRNPEHISELKEFVSSNNIADCVRFLGFIPRQDQLSLMRKAKAVVQPSLFEGWSTIVEDAKSLKIPIVVSDIEVHKEQLKDYPAALFFKKGNVLQLSECLVSSIPSGAFKYDYDIQVRKFGEEFVKIVSEIVDNP